MGFRIVQGDVVRLPLSGGKTITVKQRLTTGEERAHLKRSRVNGALDYVEHGFSMVVAYLLDWASPDGVAPDIRGADEATVIATLNALDPDDFIEVKTAIEAHVVAMVKEREEEKKTIRTGAPASSAISALPSDLAGAMTTS